MKLLTLLLPTVLLVGTQVSLADDIRGIEVGDQFTKLSEVFTEGSILTSDDPIGKEYGFKVHSIDSMEVILSARSTPNGELYHIGFAQLVPFKQADEFKNGLCQKYAISPCEWDRSMEKYNPGATIYKFDGKRKSDNKSISVSLYNARQSSQKGFIWAAASINAGQPQELVKQWESELKKAELAKKEAEARKVSDNADRVEMQF